MSGSVNYVNIYRIQDDMSSTEFISDMTALINLISNKIDELPPLKDDLEDSVNYVNIYRIDENLSYTEFISDMTGLINLIANKIVELPPYLEGDLQFLGGGAFSAGILGVTSDTFVMQLLSPEIGDEPGTEIHVTDLSNSTGSSSTGFTYANEDQTTETNKADINLYFDNVTEESGTKTGDLMVRINNSELNGYRLLSLYFQIESDNVVEDVQSSDSTTKIATWSNGAYNSEYGTNTFQYIRSLDPNYTQLMVLNNISIIDTNYEQLTLAEDYASASEGNLYWDTLGDTDSTVVKLGTVNLS